MPETIEPQEIVLETANEIKHMIHLDDLLQYCTWDNLVKIITSIIAVVIFWLVYRLIRHIAKKGAEKKFEKKVVKTITKAISYTFYVIITMYILGLLGIKLSAIWGAAGIAGVAIGFAAQTSMSNLISGLFVLTEKTMKIGDFIEVDGISGIIDSVGLLAIKIHTPDNQLVRIPNSTLIDTNLKNYSSYEYRRYVFDVSVDYATNLDNALEILKTVPEQCPTVITDNENYAPNAFLTTLGASGINMSLAVWCKRENFLQTKTDVCKNVVASFVKAGINIPFNRMDVSLLTEQTIPSLSTK